MTLIFYVVAAIAVFWIGMLSAVLMGGALFLILAAVFGSLKLVGVIAWGWWWVALPIWGAAGGAVAKMWMVTRDPMWRYKIRR